MHLGSTPACSHANSLLNKLVCILLSAHRGGAASQPTLILVEVTVPVLDARHVLSYHIAGARCAPNRHVPLNWFVEPHTKVAWC